MNRRSPITEAAHLTETAIETATHAKEFGAAFDLSVIGLVIEEDVNLHVRVVARAKALLSRLRRVTKDKKVTAAELPEVQRIERGLDELADLAEAK